MHDIRDQLGKNDYRIIDKRIREDFEKLDFSDSTVEGNKTYRHFHLQQDMQNNVMEGGDVRNFLSLGKKEYNEIRGLPFFDANEVVQMKVGHILSILSYNDLFGRSYKVKSLHYISHTYDYTMSEMLHDEIRFQGKKDGKSEDEIKARNNDIPIAYATWNDARVDTLSIYSCDFCKNEWSEGREPQYMNAE